MAWKYQKTNEQAEVALRPPAAIHPQRCYKCGVELKPGDKAKIHESNPVAWCLGCVAGLKRPDLFDAVVVGDEENMAGDADAAGDAGGSEIGSGGGVRQLERERLSVVLVPAPDPHFDGHCIRAVEMRNPAWYRRFVAGHWDRRGCQVKRERVMRALRRVAKLYIVRGNGYEGRLLKYLEA